MQSFNDGPKKKWLIVNADDLGLAETINKGIEYAFRRGIVSSGSLMGNGRAFEDAVERIRHLPELGVGIHLVLVEERPVLPPTRVPTLTDRHDHLYPDNRSFWKAVATGKIDLVEIERELSAQIEKILAAGIRPSHLDSHQHCHLYPPVLKIVIRLAKRYKISWIRHANDERSPFISTVLPGLWEMARNAKRMIANSGLKATDHCWGINARSRIQSSHLLTFFYSCPNGLTELICHPGMNDAVLNKEYGHWKFSWEAETDALCSPIVERALCETGIELCNYRDMAGCRHTPTRDE